MPSQDTEGPRKLEADVGIQRLAGEGVRSVRAGATEPLAEGRFGEPGGLAFWNRGRRVHGQGCRDERDDQDARDQVRERAPAGSAEHGYFGRGPGRAVKR